MEKGKIKVIRGPMYSSKTSKMIDEIVTKDQSTILVIKPLADTRTSVIYSRDKKEYPAVIVKNSNDIRDLLNTQKKIKHIFIDEYQFLDMGIIDVVKELSDKGIDVTVTGLDTDFKKDEFGPTLKTVEISTEDIVLQAICHFCGKPASWTVRLFNGEAAPLDAPIVLPEEFGNTVVVYKPSCDDHHPRKK